jgi:sugar phosphate isomerase/epimerase
MPDDTDRGAARATGGTAPVRPSGAPATGGAPSGPGLWWGSLEGADLETLARCAAHAGFSTVSATPAMVLAATERRGASLRRVLDDTGVQVVMIDPLLHGLPGSCDPATVNPRWRSTFEHDEDDCHRAADAVGASVVNVAHFLGAPVRRAELVDAIGAITVRAAARGRRVAVEAMPEGSIPSAHEAAAIVSAIGDPACGITLDTWHWWRTGGDLDELRALAPGSVFAVQVADADAADRGSGLHPASRDRRLPGAGAMPLREVLALLRERHPAALIGAEVFDRSRIGHDPAELASVVAATLAPFVGPSADPGPQAR